MGKNKMKNNTFLILGTVGIAVTAFLNIFLMFTLDSYNPINFSTFYIVWIVFLAIGIARMLKEKKADQ